MAERTKPGLLQVVRNAIWNPKADTRGKEFQFDSQEQLQNFLDQGGYEKNSGETITVKKSEGLDTVYSCLNAIAQDVAKTEAPVKKKVDGIKVVQYQNPIHKALNVRANKYMSSFNWLYLMAYQLESFGNSFTGINRLPNGSIELVPLMPYDVTVHVSEGELYYEWKGKTFHSRDVLHFKLFSEDGVIGLSPLLHNAKLMGYKQKQDRYSVRVIGVKPPGFVSGEGTAQQFQDNIKSWNNHMSGDDPTGIPYMAGQNVKFNPLMIPPNEGQHLETKEYSDKKICAIYRVPLSKIQFTENIKYANQEQQDVDYVKDCLLPIFKMMEQEMDYKLFSERNKQISDPLYVKFNIWGNVRADLKTRTDFYQTMVNSGVMTADEVRMDIDMPPQEDGLGSVPYIQGAMMPKTTQQFASINNSNEDNQSNQDEAEPTADEERFFEKFTKYLEKRNNGSTIQDNGQVRGPDNI